MRSTNPATAGQVFRLVRDGAANTRSEVGRITGLSRTAVAARVGALVSSGLVLESDAPIEDAGVGRPPARLSFNARAGVILAAAVGRSRTQIGVCDLAGEILGRQDLEQEVGLGPDEVLPRVAAALSDELARAGHGVAQVRGIGVSIPGTVDPAARYSRDSPIMTGWHGVPIAAYFSALSAAPVFLENDTNAIALAERNGHLLHHRDALILKASTGLGAGIASRGLLQRGAQGAAGEIGHVKYRPAAGMDCRCGDTGCLEAVAGGWALVRNARARGHQVDHLRDVVTRALGGCTDARRDIRESGRHVGEVLAAAVTLLNPGAIVVGGDITPAYDVFVAGLRETLYRDATSITTRDLQILAATHGETSGIRGCATLALDNVLDEAAVDRSLAR